MSFIAIVELSIGMIFAWLLMSVSAMFLQEWIVGLLNWRSGMLENTIENLVNDPTLKTQIYSHPLIRTLHSGTTLQNKPSYIPASQFSLALLDIINNSAKEANLIQRTLMDIKAEISSKLRGNNTTLLADLDAAISLTYKALSLDGNPNGVAGVLEEIKGILRKINDSNPKAQPIIEKHFKQFAANKKQLDEMTARTPNTNIGATVLGNGFSAMAITSPGLKSALDALVIEVKNSANKTENQITLAKNNIETWFSSSMDRLSGWYKRRAQLLSFFIGLSIALLFNIDSFQLATQLWRDPTVREIIATQAGTIVNQNPEGAVSVDQNQLLGVYMQLNQLNIPVGWIGSPMQTDSNGAIYFAENYQKKCSLHANNGVNVFGFQIGNECYPIINTPVTNDIAGWIFKLLGVLITATATAQGAPFWFDILKNLVNIRSAGTVADPRSAKSSG